MASPTYSTYCRSVVGVVVATTTACGTATDPRSNVPRRPSLAVRDTTLLVDETGVLSVTALDSLRRRVDDPAIVWQSAAPDVATVDGAGRVRAVSLGTSVVTATWSGVEARATITVARQFIALAPGETHTCGVTGRHEVFCWGMSAHGELGPTTRLQDCSLQFGPGIACSPVPVRSSSLEAVDVVTGLMHTCALAADGRAICWGGNVYGQVGTGSSTDALTPTVVAGALRFTQLVAGRMHTCGITTSGEAWCWGWDHAGQLGAGDVSSGTCTYFATGPCSLTPRLVVGGHRWARLAASEKSTCGLTTDGDVYCWGLGTGSSDGLYCQAADNLTGCTRVPVLLVSLERYRSAVVGDVHWCEQRLDKTVECWGANYFGAFGNGTLNGSSRPVTAAGGVAFASVVALRGGTCGVRDDGRAMCWGLGTDGQIGNGVMQNALTPQFVAGTERFDALAAGSVSDVVCGLAVSGRAYCWGRGLFGQLGNGGFLRVAEPTLVRLP